MAWPFNRKGRDALTASVSVVPHDGERITQRRSKDAAWQKEAWIFYKELGEVRFCARYIGNALARVRFFVGTRDHPGDPLVPIPDDAPKDDLQVRDVLDRIKGRDGTFQSLVRTYGVHRFISGESFLVGEEGLEGEQWEFLSTSELRRIQRGQGSISDLGADGVDGPMYERDKAGNGNYLQLSTESLVLRFWSRDPEFRERADSPLRPILDLCEALRMAQAMQTAGDRSRLATMGLFLIPSEAELPKAPVTDSSGHAKQQPRLMLMDQLLEAMEAAMENPGSVAAISPIMVEVKEQFIKGFQRITFEREVDKTIVARIDHLIRRFAQGVDLPPEILLGTGDANHWSAWAISEEAIAAHISPAAAEFCEDLTVGFLSPTLDEIKVKDPDRYAIGFDVTDLIVSPDRAQHAVDLYDRYELGGDHLLEALGFDPSVRPDEKEIIRRIMVARAINPRNPDPGPDIAALLGKAPPPTGAEKPTPGDPNAQVNPQQPVPAVGPQPPPGDNPDDGAQPNVDTKTKPGAPANGKSGPKQAAQDEAAPPEKQKSTPRGQNRGQTNADGKKAQQKKPAKKQKAGMIGHMVAAIDVAVDEAAGAPIDAINDPRSWAGLRGQLSRLGIIDSEVLDRVIGASMMMARKVRDVPNSVDVMATAQVLCDAAMFDEDELLDDDDPEPILL